MRLRDQFKPGVFVLFALILGVQIGCKKEETNEPPENPKGEDLEALFTSSNASIEVGDSVMFTDVSMGTPTAWEWEFEGGNPATSANQNPTVVYPDSGTFNVSLRVVNSAGENVLLQENFVTVTGPELYKDKVFTESITHYDVVYGVNNQQHKMNIFEPKDDVRAERPFILILGGGGFNGSNLSQIEPLAKELNKYGIVVGIGRYRSGPASPGLEYQTMLIKGMQDSKAAIRFIRENAAQYRIDENNIFAGGYSTGGILAHFHGFLDESDLDAQSLGFVNSVGGMEGSQGSPGVSSTVKGVFTFAGFVYNDLAFIKSDDVPIFAVHGLADTTIPHDSVVNGTTTLYGSSAIINRANDVGLPTGLYLIDNGVHNSPLTEYESYMENLLAFFREVHP